MITKSFNKKDLELFINSVEYSQLENIPISFHRAISQINNPRLEESDIILVATFNNNKTIGYLGIIPDFLFQNNEKIKFGWLSCFWVDENYKKQNIAANLFLRVIRAWNKNIMITNIVPTLETVYQKTKLFFPTEYKIGIRCYLRLNSSEILPQKHLFFNKTKKILVLFDKVANFFLNMRLNTNQKMKSKIKIIDFIDDSLNDFILKKILLNYTKRSANELNWIMSFPWILEQNNTVESNKYYFSSVSKVFKTIPLLLKENNEILGFCMMVHRNNHITIPYFYVEKNSSKVFMDYILVYMIQEKCTMITTFNIELIEIFKHYRNKFIYKKEVKKPYFISKNINNINSTNFQDGDGDCAFY